MDAQCSRWHGLDLAGRHAPASQPSASPQVSGGGLRSAGRRAAPRRSRWSRGQLYRRRRRRRAARDQVGPGQSRRWRYGDYRRHKAVTRLYRVTARFRSRRGSRLQAASWRAGFIAGLRSGAAAAGQEEQRSPEARSQCAVSCALAGFRMRGGSDGAGLAGLIARPVTERAEGLRWSRWQSFHSGGRVAHLLRHGPATIRSYQDNPLTGTDTLATLQPLTHHRHPCRRNQHQRSGA